MVLIVSTLALFLSYTSIPCKMLVQNVSNFGFFFALVIMFSVNLLGFEVGYHFNTTNL
jgi:hypothetical protein